MTVCMPFDPHGEYSPMIAGTTPSALWIVRTDATMATIFGGDRPGVCAVVGLVAINVRVPDHVGHAGVVGRVHAALDWVAAVAGRPAAGRLKKIGLVFPVLRIACTSPVASPRAIRPWSPARCSSPARIVWVALVV